MQLHSSLLLLALASSLAAQTGTILGIDGRLTNNASPSYFGRRGPAHPNGEIAMAWSYSMCNPGTVPIQWSAPMNPNHPMFAMMVVRQQNGRMEQITDNATTYVKHAFAAANSASTCGGTCQTTGTGLRVNCTDVYGAGTNANRFYLAPSGEIDPWTGVWNPVGSYFDRGDPDVGAPANTDGVRSLTSTSGGFSTDPVKNRVTLREQDLLAGGTYYMCCHILVRGEDGDLHFDNVGSREFVPAWNGSTWSFTNPTALVNGSVLNRWTGATVTNGRNGDDDGHFVVGVVVTDLGGGQWHYEYAVQNFDNNRGGATLRLPVNPTSSVTNLTFRDVDQNPLNDWTATRQGAELVFQAPGTNPLLWNTIFNFGFDCDRPPANGPVTIDQALIGPGALAVNVATQVPAGLAATTALGAGCGAPAPTLTANGLPVLPSPGFGFLLGTQPNAAVVLFAANGSNSAVDLGNGCTAYVDGSAALHGGYLADGTGQALAAFPLPASPSLEGVTLDWQAVEVQPGGPLFSAFALSNGLKILVAVR
jgi:hypothetical protein